MDYLDNLQNKSFENEVNIGEKIEEIKEKGKQKKKFRSGLQRKYIEYRKNKNDRVANLARDLFTLYFTSFEAFYAYSSNLDAVCNDVAINLKFKPGLIFNNYIKNLNEELNKHRKNNHKFQLADIYEVTDFEREVLVCISNENLYLNNFYDLIEDMKKDYNENLYSDLFNLKKLQRKDSEEEDADAEAKDCDYIADNLNKFLKEKKNLLKKFFRLNKHSDFESLEKNILKESNEIFLDKLKQEINFSLSHLIKDLELNINKKESPCTSKDPEDIFLDFTPLSNLSNSDHEYNDNNDNDNNVFNNKNQLKNNKNNSNNNEDSKNQFEKIKQKHREEIEIIQFYLQIFIFEKNFILYLSNTTSFFYGIKSCLFIDKQENLTLDFHADTTQLKSLANDYNYLLHLKIMISTHLINYETDVDSGEEKNKDFLDNEDKEDSNFSNYESGAEGKESEKSFALLKDKKKLDLEKDEKKYTTKYFDDAKGEIVYVHSIKEKNLIPFWKVHEQDVTLHPPHLEFNLENERFYRLYNEKDEFAADKLNDDIELDFENKRSNDVSNITEITGNLNNNPHHNGNFHDSPKKQAAKKNNDMHKKIVRCSTILEGNPVEEENQSFLNQITEHPQHRESEFSYSNIRKNLNNEFDKGLCNNSNSKLNHSQYVLNNNSNNNSDCLIFRNIDKLRLIKMSLNLVFDLDVLKSYPEYLTFQVVRNEKAYKENLKFKNVLGAYLDVFNDERIKKINETMRNFYGEKVAYYFYFTSHYIKWLFFPSILGIVFVILEIIFRIFKIFQMKNFQDKSDLNEKAISLRVYYVYIYLFFIVIWAVMNVKSWVGNQKYYNYCWGMDGNLVDSRIKTDNIEKAIVTMGIQIPIRSRYKEIFKRLVTVFVSLFLVIFTIFMNFVLFELGKIKVFNQDQATAVDGVIGASIKIMVRKEEIHDLKGNGMKNSLISSEAKEGFSSAFLQIKDRLNSFMLWSPEKNKTLTDINKSEEEKMFNPDSNKNKTSIIDGVNQQKIELNHTANKQFLKARETKEEIPNRNQNANSNQNNNNNNNNEKLTNKLKLKKMEQDLKDQFSLFTYKNQNRMENSTSTDESIQVIDLEHIKLKPTFWYHLIPVFSVLLRNFMSKVNYSTAIWMIEYEGHTEENTYEDSFLIKMVCYEFVNYYFYLYYIIFYKNYNNLCAGNNCYNELGSQLTTIIITSTLLNFIELLSPHVTIFYRKTFSKKKKDNKKIKNNESRESNNVNERNFDDKKIKNSQNNDEYQSNIENENEEDKEKENKNTINENPRNKFYDRLDYYDIMTYEYMELIMNFGYIILFGISSPICFLIAFLYAIVERFTDALKLTKSYNVNIIDKSTGVGIIVKILKFFIFMGILTNCIIVIFLMDFSHIGSWQRFEILLVMENILVVLFLLIAFNTLPSWFKYLDKIKFNYIMAILNNHKKLKTDESGTNYAKNSSI